MENWAALPHDLIVLIAKHVKPIEDFIAFGSVCTSWRAAATKEHFDVLSPQAPFLMLSDEKDCNYKDFYSFPGKNSFHIFLPEPIARSMSTTHGACEEVTLLHPFSHDQIHIPCIDSAVAEDYVYEYCNIYGAVLSANPSLTSDYVLVTVSTYEGSSILASWRPGDLKWTKIGNVAYVNTMLFYKGEFYVVYDTHEVWGFDSAGPSISHPRKLVSLKDFVDFGCLMIEYFLVEVSDVLLLLVIKIFSVTDCENDMNYGTSKFEVYEFDVIKGELKQINTLGESAIFLDCRCPRSMCASSIGSSKFAGVKPNHIYITNDWRQKFHCFKVSDYEKYVGAYNLEDGKVEPYCGLSLCPFSMPTWVTPSFR